MDENNVQTEQTSVEETTSTEPETTQEEPAQAQPLTEERVQQLVAEATARAVAEAKEIGRRELQSEQDRNKAIEKRARLAETRATAYETSFGNLDEETRSQVELARYRKQEELNQTTAQEESRRAEEEAYFKAMNQSLLDEVATFGIDPDDKRIDYASDAPDYFTGRKRFTESIQKVLGENKKAAEEKMSNDFKELESKLRKELNLDSVDTTAGGGSGGDSDADFKKGIGDGSIPLNKTNYERAKKLGLAQ